MPNFEPVFTEYPQQDFVNVAVDEPTTPTNNRSIPYIALAWGLYEGQENPIKFATEHLEHINSPAVPDILSNISKVYNVLEVYADRLGLQPSITLPQLTELYGLAKKLSDDKIATAVLTSLTARHLAFKDEFTHCTQFHLSDAKKIIASTKTYFKQEAAVDAMVYMISSLCREPDNYQLAACKGNAAESKKLSGANIFATQNRNKVDRIRLLLIAAQNIANQVEKKELDDAYIIFTIKQELLKQGIEEKLASAVTIVYGASYFFEENYSIPKQMHLEKAAEWLVKSEALIHYKANQASIIKFLQEYFSPNSTAEKAVKVASVVKQEIYCGNSIEGQLKYKGKIAELSWAAFVIAQDYGANYYFSTTDGAFKINRNNQGNGLYAAILPSIKATLKDDLGNAIHQLTVEQLSKKIRELLAKSKGIIIKQFSDIIRNNANILSVPVVFAEELKFLRGSYLQRDNLSIDSQNILDQDIANYLETISSRYIEFVNGNVEIGGDIELQIIAYYYNIQIKQHSHLSDDYNIINPDSKSIAHIFCALHQGHYHNLEQQKDLQLKDYTSSADYIEQAAFAIKCGKLENYLETAIAVLALSNHIMWQASNPIDPELIEQKIDEAAEKTKSIVINSLKQHGQQLLNNKKYPASNSSLKKEVPKQDLTLPSISAEQLSIIEQEAMVGIINVEFIAADDKLQSINPEQEEHKFIAAEQIQSAKRTQYSDAKMALYKVRQSVHADKYVRDLIAHHNTMFILELKALGVANLQAYRIWWQNVIKEQRNATEIAFATFNSQIDKYIVDLTKAYEQKLTEVDNHWASVLNRAIQDYNYHQRCVAEAERTAKRKGRQRMYRAVAGMAIAAFVAPYMAGSMFTPGLGCTIATGAIAGGISSGISGGNVLKGATIGGLFAGFGFGVDNLLGDFIQNSELLRESLSIAATASLSTAIYGGKVLDNVFISIGANAVAGLIVPMPKFANKELTRQQLNAINNRQVMRAFTRGITASVISKDSNLGTSLMMAGMSSLQTWISHQANTLVQERRAMEQQANIVKPRNRLAIGDKQPALQPTISANTAGAGFNKPKDASKGKSGGYQINLPETKHPCAGGLRPRIPVPDRPLSGVPSSAWQRFQENYTAVTNDMDTDALMYNLQSQQMAQLYDDYQVGTRMGSGIQAGFGVGQLGAAAVLAQTGVGIVPACLLAARGSDNLVTGGIGLVTGQDRPTMLHQAIRGIGFSDTTARWAEFGADLSPMASGMAREAGNIAKGGMLKLYDLRIAKQAKSFTISASSPGEIFHGYGELSARQTRHLSELSMPGEMMNIFKSDINITDLASLTAKTGDEFYMFTLGSRRIIARGYSDKFYFDKKIVDRLTKEGWRLSAHTHPGTSNKVLMSSGADRYALKILGQEKSVIANSSGKLGLFTKEGIDTDLSSTIFKLSSLKPQL